MLRVHGVRVAVILTTLWLQASIWHMLFGIATVPIVSIFYRISIDLGYSEHTMHFRLASMEA